MGVGCGCVRVGGRVVCGCVGGGGRGGRGGFRWSGWCVGRVQVEKGQQKWSDLSARPALSARAVGGDVGAEPRQAAGVPAHSPCPTLPAALPARSPCNPCAPHLLVGRRGGQQAGHCWAEAKRACRLVVRAELEQRRAAGALRQGGERGGGWGVGVKRGGGDDAPAAGRQHGMAGWLHARAAAAGGPSHAPSHCGAALSPAHLPRVAAGHHTLFHTLFHPLSTPFPPTLPWRQPCLWERSLLSSPPPPPPHPTCRAS